jgi:hypothetical protein
VDRVQFPGVGEVLTSTGRAALDPSDHLLEKTIHIFGNGVGVVCTVSTDPERADLYHDRVVLERLDIDLAEMTLGHSTLLLFLDDRHILTVELVRVIRVVDTGLYQHEKPGQFELGPVKTLESFSRFAENVLDYFRFVRG